MFLKCLNWRGVPLLCASRRLGPKLRGVVRGAEGPGQRRCCPKGGVVRATLRFLPQRWSSADSARGWWVAAGCAPEAKEGGVGWVSSEPPSPLRCAFGARRCWGASDLGRPD